MPNTPNVSYLNAVAGNHNYASGNIGAFSTSGDSSEQPWYESALDSIENAPKYFGLAAMSGLVGMANTFNSYLNYVIPKQYEFKEINMGKWLMDYDSDLGKYYRDNKDSIDTTGFVLGSLVPGTLGVKSFNLAQDALSVAMRTGKIEGNLASATKLLLPKYDNLIARSAEKMAATNKTWNLLESNRLQALGQKTYQGILDSAAFETASLATQSQSPFLADQSPTELATNFVTNSLLGGAVVGVFGLPGINKAIRKYRAAFDVRGSAARAQTDLGVAAPVQAQAVSDLTTKAEAQKFIESTKRYTTESADLGPQVYPPTPEGKAIATKHIADAENNIRDINNKVTAAVGKLVVSGDTHIPFADYLTKIDPIVSRGIMLFTDKLMRVGDMGKVAGDELRAAKKLLKDKGQISDNVTYSTWHQLWGTKGEDLVTLHEMPKAPSLADTVPLKGKNVSIKKAVNGFVGRQGHKVKDAVDVMDMGKSLAYVQSRYLAAARSTMKGEVTVGRADIPYLEAAHRRMIAGEVTKVTVPKVGEFDNSKDLWEYVKTAKDNVLNRGTAKLVKDTKTAGHLSLEEIAARANVTEGFASRSGVSSTDVDNYLAWQNAAREQKLSDPVDIFYKPKYMGSRTNIPMADLADATRLDADLWTKSIAKVNDSVMNNSLYDVVGHLYGKTVLADQGTGIRYAANPMDTLPEQSTLKQMLSQVNSQGALHSIFTHTRAGYDNFLGYISHIGKFKSDLDRKANKLIADILAPARQILISDPQAAAEFSVTSQLVKQRPNAVYELSEDGMSLVHYLDKETGDIDDSLTIPFKSPKTGEIWSAHIHANDLVNGAYTKIRGAQGLDSGYIPGRAYAHNPDTTRLKHYAFVVDPTITGGGRTTMLFAKSADDLQNMITAGKERFPEWDFYTSEQTKEFNKARGTYDFQRTLHEVKMNSTMQAKGIASTAFPRTDGRYLADDLANWHSRHFRGLNAEIIHAKYEQVFRELEAYARASGQLEKSVFANAYDMAAASIKNPFLSYIKTALNVTNKYDFPLLAAANRFVDDVVDKTWNQAANKLAEIKDYDPKQLDQLNKIFEHHGFRPAYYTTGLALYANHAAGKELATKFIRRAGSLMSTVFLRYDPFNAIVNNLGSTIMVSTELRHILASIDRGDTDAIGRLAYMTVPGTTDSVLSVGKLYANSLKRFVADMAGDKSVRRALSNKYVAKGWIQDIGDVIDASMDSLTLTGKESALDLTGKLKTLQQSAKKLGKTLETVTGNNFSEHMNRFMAADIMSQITDIAVAQGKITRREADSLITTFVHRTQVNYISAQRPGIFKGPIGMAMGLFQSYQFNLLQQLFRYAEGGLNKELAMFAGLQGTFFGMGSLPGWDAMNKYVMNLAGNEKHRGLDDIVSEGVPAGVASFMMYGLPSNILHANLFSRGDATPQNPLVLPTSIGDFPMISMYGRFFSNLKRTASNVAEGADLWPAFLSGLEHNSVNRPLAGIAQFLRGLTDGSGQVRSYDRAGKFISGNDLYSLATLARMAGGKPLDEAAVRQEMYKMAGVRAQQQEKLREASVALRLSMANGGADADQLMSVYDTFIQSGMNAADFNRWMLRRYQDATESEVSQLHSTLSRPLSYRMMQLMGGTDAQ